MNIGLHILYLECIRSKKVTQRKLLTFYLYLCIYIIEIYIQQIIKYVRLSHFLQISFILPIPVYLKIDFCILQIKKKKDLSYFPNNSAN